MSTIHKTFVDGVSLTGTAQVLYTAGTALKGTIEKASFYNSHTSAVTVQMYLVPTAGSATAASNQIEKKVLQPGEGWSSPNMAGHLLETGGTIQATVDVNSKVACRITGYEATS